MHGIEFDTEEFDYDEFLEKEFGKGDRRKDIKLIWWITAVLILIALGTIVIFPLFNTY